MTQVLSIKKLPRSLIQRLWSLHGRSDRPRPQGAFANRIRISCSWQSIYGLYPELACQPLGRGNSQVRVFEA
jgi:hypothetical protein